MVVGAATAVSWEVLSLVEPTTLAPMSAGILASSVTIVLVSLATQNIAPVEPHILAAMDETMRVGPIPEKMLAMSDFALRPEAEEIGSLLEEEARE